MTDFSSVRSNTDRVVVWMAQGFGSGLAPFAPGTVGTLPGLLWSMLLLWSGRWDVYGGGALMGLAASVVICGRAERLLGKRDPGSVVLDEITAMPVCFAGIALAGSAGGRFESGWLWTHWGAMVLVAAFGLFRLFDIWKPWPVRQSQALSGGWGVTIDDVLAALYAAGVLTILTRWMPWSGPSA